MKILPGLPQPVQAAETVEKKTEQDSSTKRKAAAKPSRGADQVDFSASLTAGLKAQQNQQAQRVETIKSLIKAGTYQVSSHDVAEKLLSGSSDF